MIKATWINFFVQHKVAANLLMIMMILSGVWAIGNINTQFLPNFELDFVTVTVPWRGASAEDVERSITTPIEQELRDVPYLKEMLSDSTLGMSQITLEFTEDADIGFALEDVKDRVQLVRNLPPDAEDPEIRRVVRYEEVARVIVKSPGKLEELRPLVEDMKRDLLQRGIAKIDIIGLPEEEFSIQIPSSSINELGLSLPQISQIIRQQSQDIPAGVVGKSEASKQLRSIEQRRSLEGFLNVPIQADSSGRLLTLGDVATLKRQPEEQEVLIKVNGERAVELLLQRTEIADALDSAKILSKWVAEVESTLPPGVEIKVYNQSWKLIQERIDLLVYNGLGGLVLILIILFLFLDKSVAFWVAVSIPVSFMAALAVVYLLGGSINMVSMFAMIMTLGIIVDDSIVVGENSLSNLRRGETPTDAAANGAKRMLAPVLASSLTTIAAFLPLMLVGDVIGNILFDIPLIVVCVIIASLVECFLVLPGHLNKSFKEMRHNKISDFRKNWDQGFNNFRDNYFRPVVERAIDNKMITIAAALSLFILGFSLLTTGRINFTFFPGPDGMIIYANSQFASGTPEDKVAEFLDHVDAALKKTDEQIKEEYGESIVKVSVVVQKEFVALGQDISSRGDNLGSVRVEIASSEERDISNQEFIAKWKNNVTLPAGIESFNIFTVRGGPPGADIEILLNGGNTTDLKHAAEVLKDKLQAFSGVSNVEDNIPYGRTQFIFSLNAAGEAVGLTTESVGRQIRAAFQGDLIQVFYERENEIEVRVMLPDDERETLATLDHLPIVTPAGEVLPIASVADIGTRPGIDVLKHTDGVLTAKITADVDTNVNNANHILGELSQQFLPDLKTMMNVGYSFKGRAEEQQNTFADMLRGLKFAVIFIYLILAWVFSSYGWPLAVMAIVPFGVVGAILGHWFMGIDLTILSMFGIFGLSGIVINDSIILISFYRTLREQGMKFKEAIVEAACQRLRAVILTSLTTIAGLTPLLFEDSLQAQFLIPMATSISFGLAFATVLVLILLPVFLVIYENLHRRALIFRKRHAAKLMQRCTLK